MPLCSVVGANSKVFLYCFSLEEQVLTRFEEENGGQIVVATVCLLETSRHGLLETELLQMLAEESMLTPPPYVEGESDQITVTKAETTEAGNLATSQEVFVCT